MQAANCPPNWGRSTQMLWAVPCPRTGPKLVRLRSDSLLRASLRAVFFIVSSRLGQVSGTPPGASPPGRRSAAGLIPSRGDRECAIRCQVRAPLRHGRRAVAAADLRAPRRAALRDPGATAAEVGGVALTGRVLAGEAASHWIAAPCGRRASMSARGNLYGLQPGHNACGRSVGAAADG